MKKLDILYRPRQFLLALRVDPLTENELAPASAVLNSKQMNLFTRLQPSEQLHAIRVLETLIGQGETHPDLLTAALLHDVGKSRVPLRLWERIFIVLAKMFLPNQVKKWGSGSPYGWRRPFVVAEQHPAWGAEMAADADVSPLTRLLIQKHQDDFTSELDTLEMDLLATLRAADGLQ